MTSRRLYLWLLLSILHFSFGLVIPSNSTNPILGTEIYPMFKEGINLFLDIEQDLMPQVAWAFFESVRPFVSGHPAQQEVGEDFWMWPDAGSGLTFTIHKGAKTLTWGDLNTITRGLYRYSFSEGRPKTLTYEARVRNSPRVLSYGSFDFTTGLSIANQTSKALSVATS